MLDPEFHDYIDTYLICAEKGKVIRSWLKNNETGILIKKLERKTHRPAFIRRRDGYRIHFYIHPDLFPAFSQWSNRPRLIKKTKTMLTFASGLFFHIAKVDDKYYLTIGGLASIAGISRSKLRYIALSDPRLGYELKKIGVEQDDLSNVIPIAAIPLLLTAYGSKYGDTDRIREILATDNYFVNLCDEGWANRKN